MMVKFIPEGSFSDSTSPALTAEMFISYWSAELAATWADDPREMTTLEKALKEKFNEVATTARAAAFAECEKAVQDAYDRITIPMISQDTVNFFIQAIRQRMEAERG